MFKAPWEGLGWWGPVAEIQVHHPCPCCCDRRWDLGQGVFLLSLKQPNDIHCLVELCAYKQHVVNEMLSTSQSQPRQELHFSSQYLLAQSNGRIPLATSSLSLFEDVELARSYPSDICFQGCVKVERKKDLLWGWHAWKYTCPKQTAIALSPANSLKRYYFSQENGINSPPFRQDGGRFPM